MQIRKKKNEITSKEGFSLLIYCVINKAMAIVLLLLFLIQVTYFAILSMKVSLTSTTAAEVNVTSMSLQHLNHSVITTC